MFNRKVKQNVGGVISYAWLLVLVLLLLVMSSLHTIKDDVDKDYKDYLAKDVTVEASVFNVMTYKNFIWDTFGFYNIEVNLWATNQTADNCKVNTHKQGLHAPQVPASHNGGDPTRMPATRTYYRHRISSPSPTPLNPAPPLPPLPAGP